MAKDNLMGPESPDSLEKMVLPPEGTPANGSLNHEHSNGKPAAAKAATPANEQVGNPPLTEAAGTNPKTPTETVMIFDREATAAGALKDIQAGKKISSVQFESMGKWQKFVEPIKANFRGPNTVKGLAVKGARVGVTLGAAYGMYDGAVRILQGLTGAEQGTDPETGVKKVADYGTAAVGVAEVTASIIAAYAALRAGGRSKLVR